MQIQHLQARLTVRVPRGAAGDLEGGVRDVLTAIDGVHAVEIEALSSVRPDALDLHVETRVTLDLDGSVDDPEPHLRDGFGVTAVTVPSE